MWGVQGGFPPTLFLAWGGCCLQGRFAARAEVFPSQGELGARVGCMGVRSAAHATHPHAPAVVQPARGELSL